MEVQHFSHKHPLVLREQQRHGNQAAHCSGCNEPVIGAAYCCTLCQFYLHVSCAELPNIILHSVHPQHPLTLLAKSPYPNGIYMCDLCKNTRKSFLYHCSDCDFDLEINCAFHSKLTSNVGIPGVKKIIVNSHRERELISKEEMRKPLGEIGKLEKRKGKGFEARGSREEIEHIHAEIYEMEMALNLMMDKLKNLPDMVEKILYGGETDKLNTFGGKQPCSLDFVKDEIDRVRKFQFRMMDTLENLREMKEKILDGRKTDKLDTFGEEQGSSLDFGEEYFPFPWIPEEQPISQAKTDEPEGFFLGKKSYILESDKGKDMVKKEKKEQGEIGESSSNSRSPIIFRTPFPQLEFQKLELVSIGPYHRVEEHQLDKYKHSFLEKYLSRTSNNPETDLCFYVGEIIALETPARECYSKDFLMSSDDFVKMMLVDGCFIIELMRYFGGSEGDQLSPKDPITIIMPWQIPILVQDLLLLENQIPFFVLEKLFDLSKNHKDKPEASLTTLALTFFDLAFPRSSDIISKFSTVGEPNHLLDLFVKTIRPSNPWSKPEASLTTLASKFFHLAIPRSSDIIPEFSVEELNHWLDVFVWITRPSYPWNMELEFVSKEAKNEEEKQSPIHLENGVAALRQAGIDFMPSRYDSFLDVNFKDGVIQIPVVTINNLFSSLLVNSVALENCSLYDDRPKPVTSYIYFMSCLIKDAKDANFLCSKGIISRFSANDEKVADIFNLLRPYTMIDMSNPHLFKTKKSNRKLQYWAVEGANAPVPNENSHSPPHVVCY